MKMEQSELPGNVLKIKLTGPLDIAGSQEIELPMSVVAGSRDKVAIDMSGVSFLASIGIRQLVMTARKIGGRGGRLVVFAPNDDALKVLRATGIDKIIPISTDEASAVAALGK